MSISTAFSNAASGLAASARAVQVVSANIANAMTPGYATRSLDLVASTLGGSSGGVRLLGLSRSVDTALLGFSRDSRAAAAGAQTLADYRQAMETALGLPGQGISAALAEFDTALIRAAERPDLDSRLETVTGAALDLVGKLAGVEREIQARRAGADRAIARDVEALNTGLARIDSLNDQIVAQRAGGQITLGLEDERQALITALAEIVPLREQARTDGRVVLFTSGGELLLDLEPGVFGFDAAPAMEAGMTTGAGLSGLTLRGRPIETGATGPVQGGRLAASFQIRDVEAPQLQSDLDAFAADLIGRFADPATDSTLSPGSPGLFTDAGGLAGASPGLAGRLALNAAVLPALGGQLWRLRDGLGALSAGTVGNPAGLNALSAALDRRVSTVPGGAAQSLAQSLAEVLTRHSTLRQHSEDVAAVAQGRKAGFEEQLLAQGVDSDAEMQRLLLIEKAYAANARVIETADAMLRRLLEI